MLVIFIIEEPTEWKISLNNAILEVDYILIINMLMKQLNIDVRYSYITNQLILGKISRVIYKSTKTTKSDYFDKTIQGELININKLELNEMNGTKSIISKRVKL